MAHRTRRVVAALVVPALAGALVTATPSAAGAHSLDSSTLSVHVHESSVDATVSVALETLDEALGTSYATGADVASYADEVLAYLDAHTTVTGADGTAWAETWGGAVVEQVEGLTSFSAEVQLDPAGESTSAFTVSYDAVLEAVDGHEAVVVLTDAAGEVSTAGVLTADSPTLRVGDAAASGLADMVGYGLHHVLEGADHLLFLLTLLLVAPLVARAGRWERRDGLAPSVRRVLAIVSAFTVGHSLTLLASALGWVSLPSRPVEVLIAVSVGASAVHALRPLVRGGEVLLAAGFGLVHGLAFAGILRDLGLAGTTSVPSLLAFNVGVEVAQLLAVALVLPSLLLASRTRHGAGVRTALAVLALAAATGWALDRLGLLANPLGGVEEAAVADPWLVVLALAVVAVGCRAAERVPARGGRRAGPDSPGGEAAQGPRSGPAASTVQACATSWTPSSAPGGPRA